MATLSFRNVNKIYPNKVQAVFDFNLEVKDKEFIVLVGPSGCGKSTTLRMLAGFEDISSGEIYIDDVKVNKMAPKDRNIAMVFQNYALYPHMTVYDNMAFALKLRKVAKPVLEVDAKNPEYLKKKEEVYKNNKKELETGLRDLKGKQATKEKIKEFHFAKANDLKVQLAKLDEQYSKPVYTYDLKKADELEKAIGFELNKAKILRSRIEKQINEEKNYPNEVRNGLRAQLRQENIDFKFAIRDLKRKIKHEIDPNRKNTLQAEIQKATDTHKQNIDTLNKKIEESKTLKPDANKIASLNNEIQALASIKVDEAKVASLRAELEKVYANKNQPAYYTAHYTSKEIAEKVSEAAEILGLTPYLRRKPAALSGGQRQRVALGRAIVRKPKVFLMDEPLSNLDAKLRVQTRGEISKIHQRVGATTIYVTHDQTEAMTMANRIVIMKDGYVQQVGTPKDVYENPVNIFVGGFIGSPSMNFFNGTFDGKNFVFANGKFTLPLSHNHIAALASYKNQPVVLGIRPEHFFFDDDKMLTSKSVTIPIKTDLSELLGSELIIYGDIASQKVVMKTSSRKQINPGETYKFVYDTSKVHFFDPKTTKVITYKKEAITTPISKPVVKKVVKKTKKVKVASKKKATKKKRK